MSVVSGFFIGLSLLFGSLYIGALNFLHISQQSTQATYGTVSGGGVFFDIKGNKSFYQNIGGVVTFEKGTSGPIAMPMADVSTFEVPCYGGSDLDVYAKDKNHVYDKADIMINTDPVSFAVMPETYVTTYSDGQAATEAWCTELTKDKNHLYYKGNIISNNPKGFKLLSQNLLFTDGDKVFQDGTIISNDAAHFEFISGAEGRSVCAKDSITLYACSNQSSEIDAIPSSDPATFQLVTGQSTYDAQDKNNKYLQGQIVQPVSQASVATSTAWVSLSNSTQYSQKGGVVYVFDSFGNEVVAGADPSTFVTAGRYAKDYDRVWYQSETDGSLSFVLGADTPTFQVVKGDGYDAQDKNHKYELGGILCEDTSHKTCTQSTYGASVGIWYQN